ncbi:MAG: PDZ domain-containing protein [Phycisphaerae bacterium]|nr:PDZ domain-containing protein [Phycisphaerae bacterium]
MRREVVLWSCAAVLILGSMAFAGQPRSYIGVNLDSAPLPELLTKHLRLDAGQGIRINNIMVDSPADKAGLERDDIIAVFEGQKVTGLEQVINAVRKVDVGTTVSLEVIHLGQRQTVQAKLGPAPQTVQWKYPLEPDVVTSWRPGRVFRVGPNGQDMIEIPFDKIPGGDIDVKKFFKESYTYRHSTGSEDYTITVEGDPADKDARLIVHAGDKEYSTTVGSIDSLPEKYRAAAAEAVENSRNSVKTDIRIELPEAFGPDARRKFFQSIPRPDMDRLSEQKDRVLEKLQGQMERLQQRMKEMEEHNRELLDKLLQKDQTKKSTSPEAQTPAPSEPQKKDAV